MYRGKMKCWLIVAFIAVIVFVVEKGVVNYEPKDSNGIDVASFWSDNRNIMLSLENKKLSDGTKVMPSNSNWNLYLSEDIPLEGYSYEEYYSPIVAGYDDSIFFKEANVAIIDKQRRVDLITLLNGAVEHKKFKEVWSKMSNVTAGEKTIRVVADANYEDEIKQTILMALSMKSKPTKDDCVQYAEQINYIWDNLEKTNDMTLFMGTNKDYIVITPEYNVPKDDKIVGIGDTVYVKFYLNYKEGYDSVAKDDKIMKFAGIRRRSYTGSYRKGKLHKTDWAMSMFELNQELAAYLKSFNTAPPDERENDTAEVEILPNEVEVGGDGIDTTVPSQKDNSQKEDGNSTGEWDVINKPEESSEQANRDIDPDAYSVQ